MKEKNGIFDILGLLLGVTGVDWDLDFEDDRWVLERRAARNGHVENLIRIPSPCSEAELRKAR